MESKSENNLVFISHSSLDKDKLALPLASHLEGFGVKTWLDQWEIRVGDSLQRKIYSAIEESSAIVLVLSKAALLSKWVQKEIEMAGIKQIQSNYKLIPLLVGNVTIPLSLADTAYIKCRSISANIAFQVVSSLFPQRELDWQRAKDYILRDIIFNVSDYVAGVKNEKLIENNMFIILESVFFQLVYDKFEKILGNRHELFHRGHVLDAYGEPSNINKAIYVFSQSILFELSLCGAITPSMRCSELGEYYYVNPNFDQLAADNWPLLTPPPGRKSKGKRRK